MNNYIKIKNLSSGEYGSVYKVINKLTDKIMAVKIEETETGLLEYEAKIYNCLLGIKCIPNIKSYKKDDKNNYLFMDLMDYNLKDFKKKYFQVNNSKYIIICKKIIQHLIIGLNNVHKRNIIHRDIKPENICFLSNSVKIIDFGLAKMIKNSETTINNDKKKSIIGTPNYVSLNVINLNEPTYIDELESLGYIFMYLVLDDNLLSNYFDEDNKIKKMKSTIIKYINDDSLSEIINKHLDICRSNTDNIYLELYNLYN